MQTRIGFVLFLAFTESLCLHIIVSPDEAQKILKRDDEFSKGLAGFIDKKISDSKHAKNDKREKINELKSLIEKALDGVDKRKKDAADSQVVNKKEASPPALPLDSGASKRDMAGVETLLQNLLQEVEAKKKRDAQGWPNYGKKEAPAQDNAINQKKSVIDSDSELEELYKNVKRLVKTTKLRDGVSKKSASSSENSIAEEPATEKRDSIIVSDSGERMLEKVKKMVAAKKAKNEAKSAIEKQIDNLIKKVSEDNSLKPEAVADMSLNGVKNMVSSKLKAKRSEVKSDPKPKVSLDSLMNEVNDLLKKYKKSSKDTETKKSVTVEDVAVESERHAPAAKKSTKSDRQRELIEDLLKTYKSMNKRETVKDNDVESELESLTNAIDKRSKSKRSQSGSEDKVSKETAEAIKGFDVELSSKKRRSHPK